MFHLLINVLFLYKVSIFSALGYKQTPLFVLWFLVVFFFLKKEKQCQKEMLFLANDILKTRAT